MEADNPYMTQEHLERIASFVNPEPTIKFKWGQPVRFCGGRYNGFNGIARWCGSTCASVSIKIADAPAVEVVEDLKFLEALPQPN
jgi:hypothetical protein